MPASEQESINDHDLAKSLLVALDRGVPDRLPVTTHHLMTYFLDKYMGGASNHEFFDRFDLDAIYWTAPYRPGPHSGEGP